MLKELAPLMPAQFFDISCTIPYGEEKKLPDTSGFFAEEQFATVSIGWNEAGIRCTATISSPLTESTYPDVQRGDSVELFINTRNSQSTESITPFCHHFAFLPLPVDGIQAIELTKFRGEEGRGLAQPHQFAVAFQEKRRSYTMEMTIAADALYGFDPEDVTELGFTYRINRCEGEPQHFASSSKECAIERYPRAWGTLHLQKHVR